MSNMERTWERPFSAFTSSLINSLCFHIHRCLSKVADESRFETFLYVSGFVLNAKFYRIADGQKETVTLFSETHGKSNEIAFAK